MRHFLLFSIALFFSLGTLFSNNLDSLINQAKLVEGEEKIDLLTKLCWELKFTDPKESLFYGQEGLNLLKKNSDEEREATLLKNIGVVYFLKGDLDQAETYFDRAILLFQKQNDAVGIANVSNMYGLIHNNRGTYEEALKAFEKSILLFQALGDTTKVIAVEANIGNIYLRTGEYQKAIPFYLRIVANARQQNDREKLGLNIYNLGMVYLRLGDYPKALDHLFEAAEIHKSREDHFHWIKTQNEIALIFRRLGLITEAIDLYQPALLKAIQSDYKSLVASININLGLCYFRQKRLDEALKCFNTSLEIRQSLEVLDIGHILNNIGRVYAEKGEDTQAREFYHRAIEVNTALGHKDKRGLDLSNLGQLYLKQGKLVKAEDYLLKAFAILEETGELNPLVNVTELLSRLYQERRAEAKAMNYLNLHRIYADSLYDEEKVVATTRLIIREQLKEKLAQLNQSNENLIRLENEQLATKKDNQLLFLFLIVFIGLSFIGFLLYRKRVHSTRQNLSQSLEHVKAEKKELQDNLTEQRREMVSFSLDMVQKEELLKSMRKQLSTFLKKQPENTEIRNLLNKLEISDILTKDWTYFNEIFNKAFPDFVPKIRKNYPNLSRKELQHCVLIKLNTPPVEAANILGISTESVHTARYRLRKKLNLVRQESLEDTILKI